MTKSLEVTTPSDTEILITRGFDAPRELVWEAWTSPKYLPKWMLGPPGWEMTVCEIDLRVGSTARVVWRNGEGTEMTITNRYMEIVRPERLVCAESWGPEWPETINTLVLNEKNGKTLTVNTILFPSKDARDAALKTGMTEGMEAGYTRLDELLPTFK